jgi:hypothetical protein
MGDAVPPTLWDFSLSAGLADFALAKFRALPKNRNACAEDRALQGWNSSTDASPDWRLRNRLSRYPFLRRSTSIFCPTNRVHLIHLVVDPGRGKVASLRLEHSYPWSQGMANVDLALRLHYVTTGPAPRMVVLLHGFPQTWWEWRHVIPPLVDAGFQRSNKMPRRISKLCFATVS